MLISSECVGDETRDRRREIEVRRMKHRAKEARLGQAKEEKIEKKRSNSGRFGEIVYRYNNIISQIIVFESSTHT